MDGRNQGSNTAMASRSAISGNMVNCENYVSMPLKCGLLEGVQDGLLPLGVNGVNGLQLLIQLQNDSQAFQSDAGTANDCFYSMLDVNLTYDVLEYDAETTEELSKPSSGELEYNTYSNLYSVINSSDDQQNFNPGTSETLSIFYFKCARKSSK